MGPIIRKTKIKAIQAPPDYSYLCGGIIFRKTCYILGIKIKMPVSSKLKTRESWRRISWAKNFIIE
jgi:hypothetical protein